MADLMMADKDTFSELVCSDLRLDPCQWEERLSCLALQDDPSCLEIDCLVHTDWLACAEAGYCLNTHHPPFPAEEVHWLLQPSCDSAPPPLWQRIHIFCMRKGEASSSIQHLVPQMNGFSRESFHEFLSQVSQENHLVSWHETLGSLQNPTQSSHTHPSNVLVRQVVKQLYHMEVQSLDQAISRSKTKNQNETQKVHANLTPMLAALESRNAFYLISPYTRFTLFDAALHSPAMFDDSVAKSLFVLYQLFELLHHAHSKGVTLGEVSLRSVVVDTRLWVQVRPHPLHIIGAPPRERRRSQRDKNKEQKARVSLSPSPQLDAPLAPSISGSTLTLTDSHTPSWAHSYILPTLTLSEAVTAWREGRLSNFDYLMLLNHHAGRVIGDPNNHPIFPWVIDFTSLDTNFRDLSRSKHFLTKGEDQLNFTYSSAQEEMRRAPDQDPLVPHHIGDISSDVTYYVYLARKTPKEVLCSRVRPRWVPEEYPLSMEKMYIWSPDECIPEFYIDTTIFRSMHPDLPDLQLPSWAESPEEFIRLHRSVLEGDVVSAQLHHWIDLVFGYKLTGHDAIKAKNVYLSVVDKHKNPTNAGIVQLFKSSHPKRAVSSSAPFILQEWSSYLHKSSISNVALFSIEQATPISPNTPDRDGNTKEPKTLESILNQESAKKRARPEKDPDNMPYQGQENQEEELYGSFEHVNLPDLGRSKASSTPTTNAEPGVRDFPEKVISGSKVRGDSVVLPANNLKFTRLPVVNRIIRPRRPQAEDEQMYDWQVAEVSLPKEAHLLDRLTRLEELSHFVGKSCKDEGELFPPAKMASAETPTSDRECPASRVQAALERLMVDPSYYPSFEERVGMDITAVVCTVIQLCCMRQLRAAIPINASLLQRVGIIKKLLTSGQLKLPCFLLSLVDFVLSPDTPTSTTITYLPNLTASLLLQPFLPVAPFPTYFDPLYKFLYTLEQLVRQTNLKQVILKLRQVNCNVIPAQNPEQLNKILNHISSNMTNLLDTITNDGFPLLLLHLYPFFTIPDTSFNAIFSLLEPLAQRMGHRNVERLFSLPLVHLFDRTTPPHQRARLLCRTTAHMLICRFGLGSFISRFLGFYLEAVLEPLRITNSKPVKRVNTKIMRMTSQSVLNLEVLQSQTFDGGRSRNADLSFSLALSEGHHGYDLEKDEDSSDESDVDLGPEASILAKTSMYSSLTSVDNDQESSLTPLTTITEITPTLDSDTQNLPQHLKVEHTPLTTSQGTEELVTGEKSDSRPNSPAPLYDTTSIMSDGGDTFDGFRDIRSDSFGGRSLLEDGKDEVMSSESEEEEEEPTGEERVEPTERDPVTLAVNAQIAELAADSVCWLMRRLGPLLATQHIVKPLLDGLHRCFSGVLYTSATQFPVLKCLGSFAETYGEAVILKLYIPRAEALVSSATTRMSGKNEAGVAASLALIRMAIRQLLHSTLQQSSKKLCDGYFLPLIQLLSSQTTFPSGGQGRAAICRTMVDLLLSLAERLGREEAMKVLTNTLQGFFSCFSSVHTNEQETQLWGTPQNSSMAGKPPLPDKSERVAADDLFDTSTTPTNTSPLSNSLTKKVITPANIHPLTIGEVNGFYDNTSTPEDKLLASESFQQLCATFSQAMAHAAYVPFCRVLGQQTLNSNLINTDLIEYVAYKHDNEAPTPDPLPSVLADMPDEDSDLSSPIASDSEDDPQVDAMHRVGPVAAVTSMGVDQAELRKTMWFVDLNDDDGVIVGKDERILSSDPQPAKITDSLGYRGALFEARFSSMSQQTSGSLDNPLTTALSKGVASMIAGATGVATPTVLRKEDGDNLVLEGVWSHHWERQLQRSLHSRDGFKHFRGTKMQTYSGHRGVVRSMAVSDSETMFVSASRDKTARVWRLGNHGDGEGTVGPSLTYNGHSKPVLGVELLEGLGQVLSCDGAVHVWDLESGYCIHQWSPTGGTQFTALTTLSFSHPIIVMATSDLQLRHLDVRTRTPLHSWKLQFPTGGTIRCLASTENWIAVGNSSGMINSLDIRTGELLSSWRPSEFYSNPYSFALNPKATSWSESLHQLRSTRRGNLVTSMGHGMMALWRPVYGKLVHTIKCPAHPMQFMEVCGDQLVSVSNSGHLVVNDGFESNDGGVNHAMTMRLRNRGLSSMALLPENRMLLLGADIGPITLMA